MKIYPRLQASIDRMINTFEAIPEGRKAILNRLSVYIKQKLDSDDPARLNFICTHNSRRSHISQIWAATAAAYYEIDGIETFSGGTEATAFNPRAVAAMERAGFQIEKPNGNNPHYLVSFAESEPGLECFSKTFDDPVNPSAHFAAIMTCSQADENCPFIPGAEFRLPLTYEDPKEADGTPEEAKIYDERIHQIGREIFYTFHLIGQNFVTTGLRRS